MVAGRLRSTCTEEGQLTTAVVFGFAVADGLPPVVAAAPYEVLARQLPRLLVKLLNSDGDRGVRFLPFLAKTDGQRQFLVVRDPLPVATLTSLHNRGDVDVLVDGAIGADSIKLRIHDGHSQVLRAEVDVPFAPGDPLAVMPRLWFEITTVLGWTGKPAELGLPSGAGLAWLLVAQDELLAAEAGVDRPSEVDVLRAARECCALIVDRKIARDVIIETVAHLVRAGKRPQAVVQVLVELGARAPDDVDCLRKVGGLLQACGADAEGAQVWARVAGLEPTADAVETAAALWFRSGDSEAAMAVLQEARSRGALELGGLGQLAAVADRLRNIELRDEVTAELMDSGPLPVPVARLLITFLLEEGQGDKARQIAEASLRVNADDATLWLDLGRACLMQDDCDAAKAALENCQQRGITGSEAQRDVARLLRMCTVPGLFTAMRQVEAALVRGEHKLALRTARGSIRSNPDAAEAWLFLGIVRHRLQHERRAERALRRAIDLDDSIAEAHNRLGILLVGRGDLLEGYGHLERAQRLAPDDPSTQLHLAQACVLLERKVEARSHLERAERLGASAQLLAAVQQKFFARGA